MSKEIVLYDLPSKDPCQGWSANTLKTRIVLNYKKISYRTEWTPFHKLQETLAKTGIEPNPQPCWSEYSVPLIVFPDGTPVMDSLKIAPELEKLYPTPSLHLDLGLHEEVNQAVGEAAEPLPPYFMPRLARNILHADDVEWFHADRKAKLGMSLDELEVSKGPPEKIFEAARPGFEHIERILKQSKKDAGPFILGSEPSYGDVILLALVHMFKIMGEEDFEEIVSRAEGLRELYEAGKGWCVS